MSDMAFKYLNLNVFFLKLMSQYPQDKTYGPCAKILFYAWRFLSFVLLLTLPLQSIADIFAREDVVFVDFSFNILIAGKLDLHIY